MVLLGHGFQHGIPVLFEIEVGAINKIEIDTIHLHGLRLYFIEICLVEIMILLPARVDANGLARKILEVNDLVILSGMELAFPKNRYICLVIEGKGCCGAVCVGHDDAIGGQRAFQVLGNLVCLVQEYGLVLQIEFAPEAHGRKQNGQKNQKVGDGQINRPLDGFLQMLGVQAVGCPDHEKWHEANDPVQANRSLDAQHQEQRKRHAPQRQRAVHQLLVGGECFFALESIKNRPGCNDVHHHGDVSNERADGPLLVLVAVKHIEHDVAPAVCGVEPQVEADGGQGEGQNHKWGPEALASENQAVNGKCKSKQCREVLGQEGQAQQDTAQGIKYQRLGGRCLSVCQHVHQPGAEHEQHQRGVCGDHEEQPGPWQAQIQRTNQPGMCLVFLIQGFLAQQDNAQANDAGEQHGECTQNQWVLTQHAQQENQPAHHGGVVGISSGRKYPPLIKKCLIPRHGREVGKEYFDQQCDAEYFYE